MKPTFFRKKSYLDYQFYNYHPLRAAYIHISDVCNFRCKTCNLVSSNTKKVFVPTAEVKNKLKEAKKYGLSNVIFTGQETILHPAIDKIIKWSFDEVGVNFISIVTNGLAFSYRPMQKKLLFLKKYLNKVFIGVSVNFYDAVTFSNWSGHNRELFKQWSCGFKEAESRRFVQYIDTILKRDMDMIKMLEYLSSLTGGRSRSINLRVGELMPFDHRHLENYHRLKYSLLETKREIDRIARYHPAKIEFESFPTCVFSQQELKSERYFIPNFQLVYENDIPIQYDPIIYNTFYSGATENWLINQQKLNDAYHKMFSYVDECQNCYYKRKCCGIPQVEIRLRGRKSINQEIRILKSLNWN